MLEILVAAVTKGDDRKRTKMSWMFGLLIFIVGTPFALSFGMLSDVTIFDKSLFDAADYLVSNIFMPLGALLIALFVGYRFPRERLIQEMKTEPNVLRKGLAFYLFMLRYIIPVVIILVFLNVIGVLPI